MKLPSALGAMSYNNVLEETKNYHRALLSAQPKQVNILACFHRKKKRTFMFSRIRGAIYKLVAQNGEEVLVILNQLLEQENKEKKNGLPHSFSI